MNKQVRELRFKLANYTCEYCKKSPATDLHHIINSSLRNKFEAVDTVRALCHKCHLYDPECIKYFRIELTAEMIRKYGEDVARYKMGGKLYF